MIRASILCLPLACLLAACETPPQTAPRPVPPATTRITVDPQAVSRVASAACEPAVAEALKRRYPQPGSVMLMADREQYYQRPNAQMSVNGEGVFEPDDSSSAIGFHYACLYNARTGKVDDVQMRY
ncbi:short-chain fatty acid transporter [Cupriavidus oxalaticus]|uniref:Short-chain fatty acid transporter n=1 Tax=Cupriavidus oxalaticus TaxID=96344 RepID=A0A5P3VBS2_9BURK|nr:short-chain fatty acid transporter [Cupriavidus oxalaticus]QEZ43275.1 short-chain fatty acid transporter [Cupriavidus oxalaticus]